MWAFRCLPKLATSLFRPAASFSQMRLLSDCTQMMLRQQQLIANFQLHNLREMLQKLNRGEQLQELSELMQSRLTTQGITCLSITPSVMHLPQSTSIIQDLSSQIANSADDQYNQSH